MRLLEEQSRLEKRVEESERKGEEVELRLEDELCSVRSRLAAKEEVDTPSFFFPMLPTKMSKWKVLHSFTLFFRSLLRRGSSWRRERADV